MPPDPSITQETPRITNCSAPCVFSTDSNYRALVKHPRLALHKHQLERDSGDTEAPLEHYFTPKVAQVMCPKALYIHPHQFSQFLHITAFWWFWLHTSCHYSAYSLTSPHNSLAFHALHSRTMCHTSRASCAYHFNRVVVHLALSHFSLASVFIHIPLTSYQFPLNQPSMRNLRVCLTYNFAPCTFTIVSNFAFSLQSRIFRVFSYRADFILATPLYNYSFWMWHLFGLDPLSIWCIHILFAPNFAPYKYLANVFTDNLSILACMEDIIILALKCVNALASRAPPSCCRAL